MPRIARVAPSGEGYHVLNRANAKRRLFRTNKDFLAFYEVMRLAMGRHPIRLLAWCINRELGQPTFLSRGCHRKCN
jgi:hypothetical protein